MKATSYSLLDRYIRAFVASSDNDASGTWGLLLVRGPAGTGKSVAIRQAVGADAHILTGGNLTPLGLWIAVADDPYGLFVLDDPDEMFRDVSLVRLLKAMTDTLHPKHLTWPTATKQLGGKGQPPRKFDADPKFIIVLNDRRQENANNIALETRGVVIEFVPTNEAIHERAAGWFTDGEIYEFVGRHLPLIPVLHQRFYVTAQKLKSLGIDWREYLLHEWHSDESVATILRLLEDDNLKQEERAQRYAELTGRSVRDFYNRLKSLRCAAGRKGLQFCSKQQVAQPGHTAKLQVPVKYLVVEPLAGAGTEPIRQRSPVIVNPQIESTTPELADTETCPAAGAQTAQTALESTGPVTNHGADANYATAAND